MPTSRHEPRIAPKVCAAMYSRATHHRSQIPPLFADRLPLRKTASVMAGFKCAPLTPMVRYETVSNEMPMPSAAVMRPGAILLVSIVHRASADSGAYLCGCWRRHMRPP
eukprot:3430086-Rhodomonas_salina.2